MLSNNRGFSAMPVIIIVALLVVGGAVYLQNTQPAPETIQSNPTVPEEGITNSMPASDGAAVSEMVVDGTGEVSNPSVEIEVEGGSFYYKPNEIRVKKGQNVIITLKSVDMMHDFNIDELEVSIPVTRSGESATVEFVADQVGEFEYYCSVGQHRANGQVGTLIVEE